MKDFSFKTSTIRLAYPMRLWYQFRGFYSRFKITCYNNIIINVSIPNLHSGLVSSTRHSLRIVKFPNYLIL